MSIRMYVHYLGSSTGATVAIQVNQSNHFSPRESSSAAVTIYGD